MIESADIVAITHHTSPLFTEDVVYDFTDVGGDIVHGVDALVARFSQANHPPADHTGSSYVYEAEGEVRVLSKAFGPDRQGRFQTGEYQDIVVRTAHGGRARQRKALRHRYWQH